MSYNNPFPDVPSASEMYRISNCPPSKKMAKHAKDYSSTKDANKGNEVHGILAGEAEGESPHDAELTAEMCEDQCSQLLKGWPGCFEEPRRYSEQRYGLTRLGGVVEATADTKADVIFTGQFDRLYISGNRGLLIDFKALHGNHPHALENPQLASLSVPVSIKHKLEDLRTAIVQPRKGKPTVADYDSFMLSQARDWLGRVLEKERTATPDDRNAGEWCKNCAARFGCDTFQSANIAALDVIKPETIAGDSKHQASVIFARMAELSIPQLVHIQQNVRQMMSVFLASHAAVFKQKVEAGEVPGWTIKTSPGNREINDAQKAFAALEPLGITAEAALAACSMSFGPLEEAVRKASGVKSKTEKRTTYNLTADQAKKALNAALESAGAISRKAEKSELVPVAITDS
jgi:hypothetical protein